ncbi:MAG: T9SS type A sorting domain-containing protein [Bacteroidota bacterium]
MKRLFTLLFFTFCLISAAFAQERYVSEVFTDDQIKLTENVQYATNATILALLFDPNVDEFIPEPLFMDVYEPDPTEDMETNRPMVLVVHGGDALPRLANNACWGDKTDSVTVTTARKLARMGYVAVAPNYRLGWNPLASTQDAFLDGLVDASVRAQQDFRACVRFLRKDIEEDGNTYNIHPERFAIWGTSSSAGTYSGFAAYINELEEVQSPTFFVTDEMGNIFNTFNEMEVGNIDGTVIGTNALGDTTNYINTPNYSSDFQLAALGSAISLDSGIVDVGEPPMIMFGNPRSVVTQVPNGPIQLPTTGEVVAFVQLSKGLIEDAVNLGVNDAWINAGFTDPFTAAQKADPSFGAVEGWLPLYGDPDNEYPWVHWDEVNCPANDDSFDVLPGANRAQAISQIDTMAGYFGVRACLTFGLDCPSITSTRELLLDEKIVTMSPNPTYGNIRLEANYGRTIQEVSFFSVDGKLVEQQIVDQAIYQKDQMELSPGFYTVVVRFEDGIVSKKLVVSQQ